MTIVQTVSWVAYFKGHTCTAAASIADEPTSWGRLWPLLTTAGLSLVVLAVVQLAVVPRLEVRKRREQRWETDVLALGEFLTFDYQSALDDYTSALRQGATLSDIGHGSLRENHEREAWAKYHEKRRAAVDPYGRACSRLDWLTDRVVSVDRSHPRLWRLWSDCTQANFALHAVDPRYRVHQDPIASTEALDDAVQDARQHIKSAVRQVKHLLTQPPPSPPSPPRRVTRNSWRRWRKWESERRSDPGPRPDSNIA